MGHGVGEALVEIIAAGTGKSAEEARAYLTQMQTNEKRFIREVWG